MDALPTVLIMLAVAVLTAYVVCRYKHLRRLQAEARATLRLPPQHFLSWSFPRAPSQESSSETDLFATEDSNATGSAAAPVDPEPESKNVSPVRANVLAGQSTAAIDASISSMPSVIDLGTFDWNVVEALRRRASQSLDLDKWSNIKEYFDAHYFDREAKAAAGFFHHFKGYVGEEVHADLRADMGDDVVWADRPNQPGWDHIVNGQPINVKVSKGGQSIDDHFEKYPEIPVATGTKNIDRLDEHMDSVTFPELDIDRIEGITRDGLDAIHEDFHAYAPTIPLITTIRSSAREIGLLLQGHTDAKTAGKHVLLDAGGVGLGGGGGALAGAGIGFLVGGPVGGVIGGILGRFGGVAFGTQKASELKQRPLRMAAERYEAKVIQAQRSTRRNERDAERRYDAVVLDEEKRLKQVTTAVTNQVRTKLNLCCDEYQARSKKFVVLFPEVLNRVGRKLEKYKATQLEDISRAPLLRRTVWPTLLDVRYRILESAFRERVRVVVRGERRFRKVASRLDSEQQVSEAINQIASFVREHPLESRDFDDLCSRMSRLTGSAQKAQKNLARSAANLCRAEFLKGRKRVDEVLREVTEEFAVGIERSARDVEAARHDVEVEMRRLGIEPSSGDSDFPTNS